MFRIGEFSRIARVSCRLLRYYGQLGLLEPATVDEQTGYRYYAASQLPRLNRILVLRDLGFSLEQIGEILDRDLSPDQLRAMMLVRRAEVEQELERQRERLARIESRIADLDAPGDVVFRAEPACSILTTRVQLPSFDHARALVADLLRVVPEPGRGRLIAIQHGAEFEPDALDLEIGFVMGGEIPASDHDLSIRELTSEQLAVCVRVGPPDVIHAGSTAIAREIEAGGYRLAGPNREVFLRAPAPGVDPVVEMQFPVRKA